MPKKELKIINIYHNQDLYNENDFPEFGYSNEEAKFILRKKIKKTTNSSKNKKNSNSIKK